MDNEFGYFGKSKYTGSNLKRSKVSKLDEKRMLYEKRKRKREEQSVVEEKEVWTNDMMTTLIFKLFERKGQDSFVTKREIVVQSGQNDKLIAAVLHNICYFQGKGKWFLKDDYKLHTKPKKEKEELSEDWEFESI